MNGKDRPCLVGSAEKMGKRVVLVWSVLCQEIQSAMGVLGEFLDYLKVSGKVSRKQDPP